MPAPLYLSRCSGGSFRDNGFLVRYYRYLFGAGEIGAYNLAVGPVAVQVSGADSERSRELLAIGLTGMVLWFFFWGSSLFG